MCTECKVEKTAADFDRKASGHLIAQCRECYRRKVPKAQRAIVCTQCKEEKTAADFDKYDSTHLIPVCHKCQHPMCEHCKEEHKKTERAVQRNSPAWHNGVWYCKKPLCQSALKRAKAAGPSASSGEAA